MEKFHEQEVKSMMNFVKTRGFKCYVRPFSAPFQFLLEMGRKSTNIYVFKKKKKPYWKKNSNWFQPSKS